MKYRKTCHFKYFVCTLMKLYIFCRFILVPLNIFLYYTITRIWLHYSLFLNKCKRKYVLSLIYFIRMFECCVCPAQAGSQGGSSEQGRSSRPLKSLQFGADLPLPGPCRLRSCYPQPASWAASQPNSPAGLSYLPHHKKANKCSLFGPRE